MERDPVIDNIKTTLIALVVLGHLVEPLIADSRWCRTVYLTIYTFHMPLFVLISGLFARNNPASPRKLAQVIIPFIGFSLLYEGSEFLASGKASHSLANWQPFWILWYLWSLCLWRCCLPLFQKLKHPVLTAVVIAIGAGYIESVGYTLGIARTLTFLPYFVLGASLNPAAMRTQRISQLSAAGLILAVGMMWMNAESFNHQWLWGSQSYLALGHAEWYAGGVRLCLLLLGLAVGIAFVSLIPDQPTGWTAAGCRVLYVYLWHGFFIKGMVGSGALLQLLQWGDAITVGLLGIAAAAITAFLSTETVRKMTDQYILAPLDRLILSIARRIPSPIRAVD